MSPEEFRAARDRLGMSAETMAQFLQVANGRAIRRWEAGDARIPGPVIVLLRALIASAAVREHFGVKLGGTAS